MNWLVKKYYQEAHSWKYDKKDDAICKNCSAVQSFNSSEPCINWEKYLEVEVRKNINYKKDDK